ncbi:MAG: GntR family transcriptional regulator [Chitinivibrionales bacterium]|nr:GntR family transcriptional regulator [Chitinivibrionales bacterium]
MQRERLSASQRARRELARLIEQYRREGVFVLPSYAELAGCLGVSVPTVLRACREFADNNVLIVRQGARTRIRDSAQPHPEPAPPLPQGYVYERIAESLKERLYRGDWGGERLPPQKALCDQYRVSRPTIAKSLKLLARTGVIEQRHHSYRLARRALSAQSSIVFIARRQVGNVIVPEPEGSRIQANLEVACGSFGVGLRNTAAYYQTPDELGYSFDWTRSDSLQKARLPVLGFIVHHMAIREGSRYVEELSRHRLPISVLHTYSTPRPLSFSPSSAPVASILPAADTDAGAAVARHLWAAGKARVAYLTLAPRAGWSSRRFESLRAELNRLSSSRAYVELFGTDEVPYPRERPLPTRAASKAREFANGLETAIPQEFRAPARRWVFEQAHPQWYHLEALRDRHARFFESACQLVSRALRQGSFTAFVCSNDTMASICLEYLRWQRLRVPDAIAVCSFDDSLLALRQGITSFNFGDREVAHRAVTHILYPPVSEKPKRWRSRRFVTDGFLSVRESSV